MKARKKKTLGQPHLGEQLRELHGASVVLDGLCIRVVDAVLVVGERAVRVVQALARPVPLRSSATSTLQTSPSLASSPSSLSFGVLHVTFGKTARAELAAQHERLGRRAESSLPMPKQQNRTAQQQTSGLLAKSYRVDDGHPRFILRPVPIALHLLCDEGVLLLHTLRRVPLPANTRSFC